MDPHVCLMRGSIRKKKTDEENGFVRGMKTLFYGSTKTEVPYLKSPLREELKKTKCK